MTSVMPSAASMILGFSPCHGKTKKCGPACDEPDRTEVRQGEINYFRGNTIFFSFSVYTSSYPPMDFFGTEKYRYPATGSHALFSGSILSLSSASIAWRRASGVVAGPGTLPPI